MHLLILFLQVIALTEELLEAAQDEPGNSGLAIATTAAHMPPHFQHAGGTSQNNMVSYFLHIRYNERCCMLCI